MAHGGEELRLGDIGLLGMAALLHDLGKALTPAHELPRHIGHEHSGVRPLRAVCARWKVPAEFAAVTAVANAIRPLTR